ncbi:uncharacterized protein EKO05_0004984 [Ascochyta rabiei]|uniref:Ribonuclease H2 subunit B n=1 Tax=Didymella rabiei TaxID=5454 RepID=A0A163KIC2_DIDRA|nr:uncharacterized protein EKO05_0004984 [Ascochyta rabiei]KZM27020.1 nucleus [Ascochyta rabiei]UPX14504.1 hypothetical protein EKO05_0004984 [Ascochyta rabiei]
MARATRARPAPKQPTPEPTPSTTKPLPAPTSNPPKLFVLPKDTSSDARIVTIDNPATNTPSRYYFCPSKGFYEFTRIAAPKKACRSWLITRHEDKTPQVGEKETIDGDNKEGLGSGYVNKNADLFLATPIDLLFLILPALAPKSAKEEKQHFLELDEYTDALSASSQHWQSLLAQYPTLKGMLEERMRLVCDTVTTGDETMYRISHEKLYALLVKKAERMVAKGLPPSMEDKFIKSALDVPVMSIRREESTLSAISDTPTATATAAADSQDTTTTATAAESQTATTTATPDEADIPSQPTLQTPPEIPHLLRLRTALSYLTTSYLPPYFASKTTAFQSTCPTPNFSPLTAHLTTLAQLKRDAAALRSISDNISRKRQVECDEDVVAEREEKKRRKEDEERKRKSEGRGVKALKKVDVSGMKKMSAFFSVKPKGA